MGFFDDVKSGVERAAQQTANTISNATRLPVDTFHAPGRALNNSAIGQAYNRLGSFRYVTPLGVAQDLQNSQGNIDRAKSEEDAAQERYNQSIQNVGQLAEAQRNISEDFERARPELRKGLLGGAQRTTRQEFLDKKQQSEGALAGRGILRSGITQKNNALLDAERKSKVNQAQVDIDQQLDNASMDMADQGTNSILQAYGLQGDAQAEYLRNALANMQNRSNSYANTFGNLASAGTQYYMRNKGA